MTGPSEMTKRQCSGAIHQSDNILIQEKKPLETFTLE